MFVARHFSKFRRMLSGQQEIFLLLGAGLVLRLLLAQQGTLALDQNTFIAWSRMLTVNGFKGFYANWSDYLPGYLYVLRILNFFQDFVAIEILYKLPAIFADIVTGALIYKIVKDVTNRGIGVVCLAAFIFNPAVIANSTLWGQVDIFTALFPILALYFFPKKWVLSTIALATGVLIKPQAALAAPVILYLMFKNKWSLKKISAYIFSSGGIFILGFVPFYESGSFFQFAISRISAPLEQYPYSSVNAFNFWGLFGFWKPDTGDFPAKLVGYLLFIVVSIYGFIRYKNKKMESFVLLAILLAANFLFFTRMHERHLLPLLAPLLVGAAVNPAFWISYIGFSLVYIFNLYYSYVWITDNFSESIPPFTIGILIGVNLIMFFIMFIQTKYQKSLLKNLVKMRVPRRRTPLLKQLVSPEHARLLLLSILLITAATRIYMLHEPQREYFDEVYHAFTARNILVGDKRPWHWSNSAPEGYAFEWTHPPLAKEGMVLGMVIFGNNSFGWRLPAVLLSLGVSYLVYRLAIWFTGSYEVGLLTVGALCLDGLIFVMSRIGMNDMYFLFFMLLSLWAFLTKRNFVSSFALGLAAASKWSVIWFLPILAVSHFALKRKITTSYVWYFILPPLIYFVTYLPMFAFGYTLQTFVDMQKQMWWYHTGLDATHAYTSPWYSWPFLVRPIYLYVGPILGNMVSRIYAMGNPMVFWSGVLGVCISAWYAVRERNKKIGILVFSYAVFFVSWAASPRIMFLYHYLPSIPFMAILLGYALRRNKVFILPFFTIAIILFIYFYPHWTGIYISEGLDRSYYWFSSWR